MGAAPKDLSEAAAFLPLQSESLQESLVFVLGRRKEPLVLSALISLAGQSPSERVRCATIHALAVCPYELQESVADRSKRWYSRGARIAAAEEALESGLGTHPGFEDISPITNGQALVFLTATVEDPTTPQSVLLNTVLALSQSTGNGRVYCQLLSLLSRKDVTTDVRLHATRALIAARQFPDDLQRLLSDPAIEDSFKRQIVGSIDANLLPAGFLIPKQDEISREDSDLGLSVFALRARDGQQSFSELFSIYLNAKNDEYRWRVFDILARFRPSECGPVLEKAMADENALVRRRALLFLMDHPEMTSQTKAVLGTVRSMRLTDLSQENRDLAQSIEERSEMRGSQK